MVRLLILLIAFWPSFAQAGPWPRGQGNMFLSVEGFYGLDGDGGSSLYFEYGQTDRLTHGGSLFVDWSGKVTEFSGFSRFSFATNNPRDQMALSFGTRMRTASQSLFYWQYETVNGFTFPARMIEERYEWLSPSTSLGLSWGRGFDKGWVTLDGEVEYDFDRKLGGLHTLATVGWKVSDRWTLLGQTRFQGDDAGYRNISLSPMAVWSMTDSVQLTGGVIFGRSEGARTAAVRLGLWSTF